MKCFSIKQCARNACLAGLLVACLFNPAAAKDAVKSSVADLRYGVVLYHYYQQDYLQSLSELMVADARDGIRGHGDNPLLINGGVSLAFGMQNHAEKIFSQVLEDQQRPQSVRDAAWFYLGKLQYTRSDWPAAEQSFSRVSEKFNADLLAEMRSLQVNLHIKKGQYAGITSKQVRAQEQGSWAAFSLYNLFAAHARDGDLNAAKKILRDLEVLPLDKDKKNYQEYYALLDKTYTAFGYGLLQQKDYAKAALEFNKVSVDGAASNQALLGYGWAAMAQGKHVDAIKSWQVLQKRSLLFIPAQEALVALPFAYEKLNAPADALREYEKAEQLLTREINLVSDMRSALTVAELLELVGSKPVSDKIAAPVASGDRSATMPGISAQVVDDGQNWLKINNTSIVKTQSIYLRELFMRNDFQAQVLDLRDLIKLRNMLQAWQPKLIAYGELLQQKQLLRQQQQAKIAQQSPLQKQRDLQQRRTALLQRFTTIKDNQDYLALADDSVRSTYAIVERSEVRLQQLKGSGQDTSDLDSRLSLLRGLLLWDAAQQFSAGVAENEMAMEKIDAALARMAVTESQIQHLNATGADLQPKFTSLQQQQKQLQEQLRQIDSAIAQRADNLQQQVVQQLANHEKRLNRYLAQSRLAVARLYDTALRAQTP